MFYLMLRRGQIDECPLRLPPVGRRRSNKRYRTREVWLLEANASAGMRDAHHFAFRHGGEWHIFEVNNAVPLRSLPGDSRAAVEMWLRHKAQVT